MGEAVAVVLAAGSGERLGSPTPKAFVGVRGRPMLVHAAGAALACRDIAWVVAAVPGGLEDLAHAMLEPVGAHAVVLGGATRQASVRAALGAVPEEVESIVCHDAARPFASPTLFGAVLGALRDADGVVPVVPIPDTVKRIRDGIVVATEPREDLALAQTPQAFRAHALRDALSRAAEAGLEFTDEAGALEWAGYQVRAIPGDPANLKITTLDDLALAERMATEAARG
jgi:2-C-methyl-D-erythritol 4-phosphate cytidylyltransferase